MGTKKILKGIRRLELWHEGDRNDGWQVDYVEVIDNQTGDSYCFLVNGMLDVNSGLKLTHVFLDNPSINMPCSDEFQDQKRMKYRKLSHANSSKDNQVIQRNFIIRTKTG